MIFCIFLYCPLIHMLKRFIQKLRMKAFQYIFVYILSSTQVPHPHFALYSGWRIQFTLEVVKQMWLLSFSVHFSISFKFLLQPKLSLYLLPRDLPAIHWSVKKAETLTLFPHITSTSLYLVSSTWRVYYLQNYIQQSFYRKRIVLQPAMSFLIINSFAECHCHIKRHCPG